MTSRRLHKAMLAVHLLASVGWIGAALAYLALDVSTLTSEDPATLRASYMAMDSIARAVLVPLGIASLVTGVATSIVSRWGLLRHYWVVISLVLTTVAVTVLSIETRVIAASAAAASDPTVSAASIRALPSTLVHSGGGVVVLLVILVLNVAKPRGMTKYGWRKQQPSSRA